LPLDPPPRDCKGDVLPHDHAGIGPDDGIIRRISPQYMVDDPKTQGKRLSSMAFQPSTNDHGGMSVDLQKLIEGAGLDARRYVISPPWIGAVRFAAGILRAEGLRIGYDPLPPGNPYHGEVWGDFTQSLRKRLCGLAEWFVRIGAD